MTVEEEEGGGGEEKEKEKEEREEEELDDGIYIEMWIVIFFSLLQGC
jgi:hypothetical protein